MTQTITIETIGRHNSVSRSAARDCPEYIVRAGRENTRVQRTTRWRNAHATAEQSADSQRVAITASKCGRWPSIWAKQQRIYLLQTLIDQYRTLQGTVSSGGDTPESLPAIDKELERLKAQLAEMTPRYTDRHPDLRKLKEQIAQTEKTMQKTVEKLEKEAPADTFSEPTPTQTRKPKHSRSTP